MLRCCYCARDIYESVWWKTEEERENNIGMNVVVPVSPPSSHYKFPALSLKSEFKE